MITYNKVYDQITTKKKTQYETQYTDQILCINKMKLQIIIKTPQADSTYLNIQ